MLSAAGRLMRLGVAPRLPLSDAHSGAVLPSSSTTYLVPSIANSYITAMTTVRYHPDAIKSVKRHGNVASRICRAIEEYAAETGAHANSVTRLVGSTARGLRVGDFRVIFEESGTEIFVTQIAPRGGAYD